MRVIRRNIAFSIVYNAIGAGLAMTGHLSPLVAAVLMPASSLTVVLRVVARPRVPRQGARMSILYIVVPLALLVVAGTVAAFVWAAHRGQFDDLDTPAVRMLHDDDETRRDSSWRDPFVGRTSVLRPGNVAKQRQHCHRLALRTPARPTL